jgi:hypothetical protein
MDRIQSGEGVVGVTVEGLYYMYLENIELWSFLYVYCTGSRLSFL